MHHHLCDRYFKVLIQEMNLKVDQGFLNAILELFAANEPLPREQEVSVFATSFCFRSCIEFLLIVCMCMCKREECGCVCVCMCLVQELVLSNAPTIIVYSSDKKQPVFMHLYMHMFVLEKYVSTLVSQRECAHWFHRASMHIHVFVCKAMCLCMPAHIHTFACRLFTLSVTLFDTVSVCVCVCSDYPVQAGPGVHREDSDGRGRAVPGWGAEELLRLPALLSHQGKQLQYCAWMLFQALSLSLSIYVYMSVCFSLQYCAWMLLQALSLCLYQSLCICLSVSLSSTVHKCCYRLSVCLYQSLCICLSVSLSSTVHKCCYRLSVCLYQSLCICLSVSLSSTVHKCCYRLSLSLSVSVYMSVCFSLQYCA